MTSKSITPKKIPVKALALLGYELSGATGILPKGCPWQNREAGLRNAKASIYNLNKSFSDDFKIYHTKKNPSQSTMPCWDMN